MTDDIKQIGGIWLPAGEQHLKQTLEATAQKTGRGTYQIATLGVMMNYVDPSRRRTMLDIGGHVGLWSMHLSRYFEKVIAFEPVPVMQRCFELNMNNPQHPVAANVELRRYGLGDENTELMISFEKDNSGHTHVESDDPDRKIAGAELIPVTIKRLDDEIFENIDAVKIDVEGFEFAVLKGAEQTFRQHKPVVCLEQKPHNFYKWSQFDAAKLLASWGAVPRHRVIDDYIFSWN